MVLLLGDYDTTETVIIPFNAFSSDDPSASVTITNLAAADIKIHKDGGTAQRASASGITVSIDFDSITGNHIVAIDLSDNTDAGYYEAGSRYQVRMEGATIDGATVNAWIGAFSIGRTISAAATVNLEDMYDGTGYADETAPATQSQVSNIGSGGSGATNHLITDDNVDGALTYGGVFVGVQTSGTYATLEGDALSYHNIDDTGNAISIVYYGNVGGNREAVNILWQGYLNSGNDEVQVHVYDFVGATWDLVYTIDGKNNSTNVVEPPMRLAGKHTGTGSELGDVYIRFSCTGQSGPSLYDAILMIEAVNTSLSVGYAAGAIWVDSAGTAGSEAYINGTADNPCPWANALTLNASLGLNRFHIANDVTITLSAALNDSTIYGEHWYLALGGQSINDTLIEGCAQITGMGSAANHVEIRQSYFGAGTYPPGRYINCGFGLSDGLFTAASAGEYVFIDCVSLVAGSGTPDFTFAGTGATTGINNRRWAGGFAVTLDANCTLSHEVLAGGGCTITTGGGNAEIRGITRALTVTMSAAETVQFAGITGPITLSGTTTGTVNLYGVFNEPVNTTSAAVVNQNRTPTNAEMVARTLVAASYFDPAADTVANVTTVATNADMRGTDGAALAVTALTDATWTDARAAYLDELAAANVPADVDTLLTRLTAARAAVLTDWINGGRLDLILDAIPTTPMRGTDSAALATALTTHDNKLAPVALDSGGATIGGMLTKIADDNGGADFDAADDSLERIANTAPLGTAMRGTDNAATAADVLAQAGAALVAIHLDHLLAVDYDPTSKPGVATALWNELVENDGGIARYTANALEQAPGGSGGDATEAKQDTILANLSTAQTDLDIVTGVDGTTLATLQGNYAPAKAADVLAQTAAALVAIHLDHLLAVDYDPASRPGVATALLNEIIENDGGVSRFTANALEEASGTGATAAQVWSYTTRTLTVPAVSSDSTTSTEITIKRGTTWTIQVTGLGDISGRSKLWFTVKRTKKQYVDSQSTAQIEETVGLVYVNGAVAATPTNGTIVVDDAIDGDITITVDEVETQNITEMNDGFWDVKILSGGNVTVPAEGKFNVTLDVTQAIS